MKLMKIALLLFCMLATFVGAAESSPSATGSQFRDKKFSVPNETFSWKGQEVKLFDWLPIFSSKLDNCLRATGVSGIAQECSLEARIVVHENVVASAASNAVVQASSPLMVISYKVQHSVTCRVKAKGGVSLDALAFSATDVKAFIEQTADAAANILSDNLTADLLPPEVTGRTEQGLLVVKAREQSALRAGEFLTVFARGEEVKDASGKVVDWSEEAVGTVQIVRVSPETVQAQIVEGNSSQIKPGCRLRRVVIGK